MQICAHIAGTSMREVFPQQASGQPSIPQPLIVAPGVYSYNAPVYDMTEEGLYRFAHHYTATEPWSDKGHRIVFNGDHERLIGSLCGICIHGTTDSTLSHGERVQKARTDWLRMTCGHKVQFIADVLTAHGIPTRKVSLVTMGTPDNVNDGHVMLEADLGGAWKLFDVDNDRRFVSATNGVRLNAKTISEEVAVGNVTDVPLIVGPKYATTSGAINPFLMSMFVDTPDRLRQWTQRIFQAVGIHHSDGLVYFKIPAGYESRKSWLLSLSSQWRVIDDHNAWRETFY